MVCPGIRSTDIYATWMKQAALRKAGGKDGMNVR
jgi:hypothetical protein